MSPGRQPVSPSLTLPTLYSSPSLFQTADTISGDKINCPSICLPSLALSLHGKGWINEVAVPPDTQNMDSRASLSLVPTSASPIIPIHIKRIHFPYMIAMMQKTQTL